MKKKFIIGLFSLLFGFGIGFNCFSVYYTPAVYFFYGNGFSLTNQRHFVFFDGHKSSLKDFSLSSGLFNNFNIGSYSSQNYAISSKGSNSWLISGTGYTPDWSIPFSTSGSFISSGIISYSNSAENLAVLGQYTSGYTFDGSLSVVGFNDYNNYSFVYNFYHDLGSAFDSLTFYSLSSYHTCRFNYNNDFHNYDLNTYRQSYNYGYCFPKSTGNNYSFSFFKPGSTISYGYDLSSKTSFCDNISSSTKFLNYGNGYSYIYLTNSGNSISWDRLHFGSTPDFSSNSDLLFQDFNDYGISLFTFNTFGSTDSSPLTGLFYYDGKTFGLTKDNSDPTKLDLFLFDCKITSVDTLRNDYIYNNGNQCPILKSWSLSNILPFSSFTGSVSLSSFKSSNFYSTFFSDPSQHYVSYYMVSCDSSLGIDAYCNGSSFDSVVSDGSIGFAGLVFSPDNTISLTFPNYDQFSCMGQGGGGNPNSTGLYINVDVQNADVFYYGSSGESYKVFDIGNYNISDSLSNNGFDGSNFSGSSDFISNLISNEFYLFQCPYTGSYFSFKLGQLLTSFNLPNWLNIDLLGWANCPIYGLINGFSFNKVSYYNNPMLVGTGYFLNSNNYDRTNYFKFFDSLLVFVIFIIVLSLYNFISKKL